MQSLEYKGVPSALYQTGGGQFPIKDRDFSRCAAQIYVY